MIHWFANQDFAFSKMIPMNIFEVFLAFSMVYSLRFLILEFKFKNILTTFVLLFSFLIFRNILNNFYQTKDEIVQTHYFKNPIYIDKKGKKATFYLTKSSDSGKIKKSIIEPYLTSRRIQNFEIVQK